MFDLKKKMHNANHRSSSVNALKFITEIKPFLTSDRITNHFNGISHLLHDSNFKLSLDEVLWLLEFSVV